VVAAFDFKRFFENNQRQARLLFVAHRREILEQAIGTFRAVLLHPAFGELLVGPPSRCARPHPEMTMSVCLSGCVCHAVRAPGSNVTLEPLTRAGAGA